MQLTARQQEILDFIRARMRKAGMPPTRAEIVEHFGFASPNAAQCHLRALAAHGAIELRPGTARGIVLAEGQADPSVDDSRSLAVPLIGRVAAGTPLLAVVNHEDEVRLDADLFRPRPDYALRVSGDSMTGAGIEHGDLLLVHHTPEARPGQIVVARIDDEVTVKRYRRRGRNIVLASENPDYPDIQVSSTRPFAIEGLAVGSLRRFASR